MIRVRGRVDEAIVSYDTKHPALLPSNHWLSWLIRKHAHQRGHNGVVATTTKTRKKFLILKANKLSKAVKFKCGFCGELEHRTETQLIANLPALRLAPYTPPLLHRKRLFRALQRQDLKKQNRKALRSLVHMSEHKSCPFGDGSRPQYNEVPSGPTKIPGYTRTTSSHTE